MSFTPSAAELALVAQIFAKADPQKIGILTGDAALKVFGGAKLSPIVLGEIWNIADEDNNGWLPRKSVAIAVRLMGWAQKGETITVALINKRERTCNLAVGVRLLRMFAP
jgi:epidermal growth factor receptor substrate 15